MKKEKMYCIAKRLATDSFVKINQSTIINIDYIDVLNKDRIVIKNKKAYKMSREYKKDLIKKYFGV